MMEDSQRVFNLWSMLLVLARRRKFIVAFVLICTVGAVAVALILPKWYRAKTSILPSQHDQLGGLTGNFAQFAISSAGFDLPIMATPSDVYATMLKSETVGRAVIIKLGLQEYFQMPKYQDCYLNLKDNMTVKVSPEGVVEIYYEDKNAEMAARIANTLVDELDKLNRQVRAAKARADREFIYYHLDSTKILLDKARTELLTFQTTNKAVDLDGQKKLALSTAETIKSELALKSAVLDVKKRLYSEGHSSLILLEQEVAELGQQLELLETGSGTDSYFGLPVAKIPGLTLKVEELEGQVTLYGKLCDMLTELYEEARIKEQKDTPTIAVLEHAVPPEIKYRPKRLMITLVSFCCSFVLGVFIALFAEYLEDLRRTSPADFELMQQVRKEITGKTGYGES